MPRKNRSEEFDKLGRNPKNDERTAIEQKLKEFNPLLQTLIDSIEGKVFIKDTSGKYLFVNKAFEKGFGIDPGAVIGKDDYFVFSPEVAAKLQANDRRILSVKKTELFEESGVVQGKNLTYLSNKVPLFDGNGDVLGICGIAFDITQQKEMEQTLRRIKLKLENKVTTLEDETSKRKHAEVSLQKSKNQYLRLLEDLGEKFVVYSHGLDGILTYASPGIKSIFGIPRDSVIGHDWIKITEWEPGDLELGGENIRNMISGTAHRRMTMSFKHPDGKKRTIFISPHPVKNSTGNVVAVEGILEDITERIQVEKALEKAHNDLERQVEERTAQLS